MPTNPDSNPVAAASRPGGDPTSVLRVAVGGPVVEDLYDYLPPTPSIEPPAPGARVLVPFGRGFRVGMVVEWASGSELESDRLKPAIRTLDPRPLLGPADLESMRWAAAYYRHPLGDAIFSALPVRLRRPESALDGHVPGLCATPAGLALDIGELARAPLQRRILERLRETPPGVSLAELRSGFGQATGAIRELQSKGLAATCQAQPIQPSADDEESPPDPGPEPNLDQARALASVVASLGRFAAFLLEGVTGSGKTEVYIRLIRETLDRGLQTLVLVPEIGLTPQLQSRLRRRLPGPIAVLHSALNERERERAWHLAASGRATLVLGTRSACFAPLPKLGLVLVDEEHDPSLKQQEGFRYSARDLAVRRAQQAGCPAVLGSATPSLETLQNARSGRYRHLRLTSRAGGASAPTLALIDIRGQPLSAGLSPLLRSHLDAETAAGNQVLLFLNRRGYAPVLTCHDCGWVGACPHCDARLTVHRRIERLWCHHCGWYRTSPQVCPECGGLDLRTLGVGTERLESELRSVFPDIPLARIDRDSTRRKGELERMLESVRRGEVLILLGTQMLAKGHDFPGVTLVGILDLDQSLYAADFRAPERTAQLLVQVAGRAGRAERPGRVLIQTRHPEHPLLRSLLAEGYPGFAERALEERAAARLPPFGHLALLRADSPDPEAPTEFLREARRLALEPMQEETGRVDIHGPVPAPMERRAGRWRAQLLAESGSRPVLQRFLAVWSDRLRSLPRPKGLRWSLDVDPQDML